MSSALPWRVSGVACCSREKVAHLNTKSVLPGQGEDDVDVDVDVDQRRPAAARVASCTCWQPMQRLAVG